MKFESTRDVEDFSNTHVLNNKTHIETVSAHRTLLGKGLLTSTNPSINDDSEKKLIQLTKYYTGLELYLDKHSDDVRKLDIQQPCSDFYGISKSYASYKEETNFIYIKNVKRSNLSNDVFFLRVAK